MKEPIEDTAELAPSPVSDHSPSLLEIEECIRYYPPNLERIADPADVFRAESGAVREIDLFVDVPFCGTICGFCPFNIYPYASADIDGYLEAFEKEIQIIGALHDLDRVRVRTVWVGGGTPSLLADSALDALLGLLADRFDLSRVREFTVEVKPTPEALTDAKLDLLRRHRVDRISMGIQTTSENLLRMLGRGYQPAAATQAIRIVKDARFALNIDMMYRLPGQTLDQVRVDADAVQSLGVDHQSWFPYVPHEGTALARRIERGRVPAPTDRDGYLGMYDAVIERMTDAGYRQYTPYYFALGGDCEYHVDRWRLPQLETLGIGAGAFSFFNGWIYTGEHDPGRYRDAVHAGKPPVMLAKRLSRTERITRLAVLGVKFLTIDLAEFERHAGVRLEEYYARELDHLERSGLIEIYDDRIDCTPLGRAFNNDVAMILSTDAAQRTKHPQAVDFMRPRS